MRSRDEGLRAESFRALGFRTSAFRVWASSELMMRLACNVSRLVGSGWRIQTPAENPQPYEFEAVYP